MLGDTGLPWKTSVWGEDIAETPIAELTLERGGHLQIGLENHACSDSYRSNLDVFLAMRDLAGRHGRTVASPAEAIEFLDLPSPVAASPLEENLWPR